MDALLPQDRLARQRLAQAAIIAAHTPAVAARLKDIDTWASPASPEEQERLLQRWMNPPVPEPNTTVFGGQYIPRRLLPTERILSAHFLTSSGAFTKFDSVLISSEYQVSYIFAETLVALGHGFIPAKVRLSRNPKGGVLEPIGIATLYVSFSEGTEFQHTLAPFFVDFLVLDVPAVERGVYAIFGKPDIERAVGTANPF